MTLQKIEFECDIPDGYRFVRYGVPKNGDKYISIDGSSLVLYTIPVHTNRIIVEKIPEQEQQTQNTKRHKHADLIHAWAEGADIQYNCLITGWKDIEDPCFYEDNEYRIKPKTKIVRFRNWYHTNGRVYASHSQCEENGPDFVKWLGDWQEVDVEE